MVLFEKKECSINKYRNKKYQITSPFDPKDNSKNFDTLFIEI